MENSRRCDVCNIDIHRAFFAKHLRNKKHLEKIRQDERFISDWLFRKEQESKENKITKIHNPKTFQTDSYRKYFEKMMKN